MRAVDEQLAGLEAERLADGREHALGVGRAAEIAEQREVEADEQPRPRPAVGSWSASAVVESGRCTPSAKSQVAAPHMRA